MCNKKCLKNTILVLMAITAMIGISLLACIIIVSRTIYDTESYWPGPVFSNTSSYRSRRSSVANEGIGTSTFNPSIWSSIETQWIEVLLAFLLLAGAISALFSMGGGCLVSIYSQTGIRVLLVALTILTMMEIGTIVFIIVTNHVIAISRTIICNSQGAGTPLVCAIVKGTILHLPNILLTLLILQVFLHNIQIILVYRLDWILHISPIGKSRLLPTSLEQDGRLFYLPSPETSRPQASSSRRQSKICFDCGRDINAQEPYYQFIPYNNPYNNLKTYTRYTTNSSDSDIIRCRSCHESQTNPTLTTQRSFYDFVDEVRPFVRQSSYRAAMDQEAEDEPFINRETQELVLKFRDDGVESYDSVSVNEILSSSHTDNRSNKRLESGDGHIRIETQGSQDNDSGRATKTETESGPPSKEVSPKETLDHLCGSSSVATHTEPQPTDPTEDEDLNTIMANVYEYLYAQQLEKDSKSGSLDRYMKPLPFPVANLELEKSQTKTHMIKSKSTQPMKSAMKPPLKPHAHVSFDEARKPKEKILPRSPRIPQLRDLSYVEMGPKSRYQTTSFTDHPRSHYSLQTTNHRQRPKTRTNSLASHRDHLSTAYIQDNERMYMPNYSQTYVHNITDPYMSPGFHSHFRSSPRYGYRSKLEPVVSHKPPVARRDLNPQPPIPVHRVRPLNYSFDYAQPQASGFGYSVYEKYPTSSTALLQQTEPYFPDQRTPLVQFRPGYI